MNTEVTHKKNVLKKVIWVKCHDFGDQSIFTFRLKDMLPYFDSSCYDALPTYIAHKGA